jgi:hypothetical protein
LRLWQQSHAWLTLTISLRGSQGREAIVVASKESGGVLGLLTDYC